MLQLTVRTGFLAAVLALLTACSVPEDTVLEYRAGALVPVFIELLNDVGNDEAVISYTAPICADEVIIHQLRRGPDLTIQAFARIEEQECEDLTALGEDGAVVIDLSAMEDDGQDTVFYDGWCLAVGVPCETPRGDVLSVSPRDPPGRR